MTQYKLLSEEWDMAEDLATGHAVGGVGALTMRFFKLKQAKELFLKEYPTPKDLQKKLEPIMDRNPMARKIYTKLEGMDQTKYIWWIKLKLLHSYSVLRMLGNYLLSPIAMMYQGADMLHNKYIKSSGDMINDVINSDKDMGNMYYK